MVKQNSPKTALYALADGALLSGIPGWKFTVKADGFTLKEKGLFEGGTVSPGGGLILWGGRKLSLENGRLMLQSGSGSFDVSAADILQLYCKREFEYHPGGKNRSSYYMTMYILYAVLRTGRHIKVISSEKLLDVHSLEVFLERRLEIKDTPVLGEFYGTESDSVLTYHSRSDLPHEESVITAEIFCPKCKMSLGASKDDFPDDKYHCNSCGENFDSKYKEHRMKEVPLDKSLVCSIEGHDLVVKRKQAGFYLIIAVMLAMFFLYLFTMDFPSLRAAFPFIVIAVSALTGALSFNLKVIRVSGDSLDVSVKPYHPFLGKLYSCFFKESSYATKDIKQIFVTDSAESGTQRFSLCALTHDGDELVLDFLTGEPPAKAVGILQSMEVMIEKRLGIEDQNVSSEIIG